MRAEFVKIIPLTQLELGLILAFCAYCVLWARPELILGFHLAAGLWTRLIVFGGISNNWVFLVTTMAALTVYVIKDRRANLIRYGPGLGPKRVIPPLDSWIIPWVLLWLGWIYLVLYQLKATLPYNVDTYMIFATIPSVVVVMLIGADLKRVRGFALGYIISGVLGCYFALRVLDIPIDYLIQDPGLEGVIRLGLGNYHFFSRFCAMGVILCIAFFLSTKRWWIAALSLVAAGILAHFVLLSGARQSMSGVIVAAAVFIVWALRRGGVLTARAGIIIGLILFLGISIYQVAPHLVVRGDEDGVSESFNVFSDRGWLWMIGLQAFLASPIWGTGFSEDVLAHNIFVSVLSDHGIVGGIFFAGFFAFALKRVFLLFRDTDSSEAAVWRIAFANIFIFAMVHAQAAGNAVKMPHLFWSVAMLWALEHNFASRQAAAEVPTPTALQTIRQVVSGAHRNQDGDTGRPTGLVPPGHRTT